MAFIIQKTIYNNTLKNIRIDARVVELMALHLAGAKLPTYLEVLYDADGDRKITLKDFVFRMKNVAGIERNAYMEDM